MSGRTIVGSGQSTTDSLSFRKPGDKAGSETIVLTQSQMPSHFHTMNYTEKTPDTKGVIGHLNVNSLEGSEGTKNTDTVGGDQPHDNMMPFLSLYAMIRVR